MKKILLFILAAFICSSIHATMVEVFAKDGRSFKSSLVSASDTMLVVQPVNGAANTTLRVTPDMVRYYIIDRVARVDVVDGKFVPSDKAQEKLSQRNDRLEKRIERASNPNDVIARAFKGTGSVCIGVGLPTAIAGGVLLGIGLSTSGSTAQQIENAATKAKCQMAGCVLLSSGAALTIVGIPLCIHGNRIAELNFNYTGNGMGVAMNF